MARKILGVKISKDKSVDKLMLSQVEYIEKVLQRINMHEVKSISTPLANLFKLSNNQTSMIKVKK